MAIEKMNRKILSNEKKSLIFLKNSAACCTPHL